MPDFKIKTVEAIYEGNALRLHQPLPLSEQQRVWVFVVPVPEQETWLQPPSPDQILHLAAQVYKGLSQEDISEIERIALDRSRFFISRSRS